MGSVQSLKGVTLVRWSSICSNSEASHTVMIWLKKFLYCQSQCISRSSEKCQCVGYDCARLYCFVVHISTISFQMSCHSSVAFSCFNYNKLDASVFRYSSLLSFSEHLRRESFELLNMRTYFFMPLFFSFLFLVCENHVNTNGPYTITIPLVWCKV